MTDDRATASPTKVSTLTLSTFVVGSMVGAGVFSLPGTFAEQTGVAGSAIAWAVAGGGMLMLALVFHQLAQRRPQLDAGVYSYARAGFGRYLGFLSAFGYWASACAGNVFYWVFIMSTLGAVIPGLGEGNTPLAVALSSAGLWVFFLLIRRGTREAAAVNRIVSVAKVLPIVVFIALCLFAFDPAVFAANLSGGADLPLFDQVRGTLLVTVFAFIGVEGASAYSRHARRRQDVGRATVLGFLSVLAIFMSVTIVSFGILPREQIAALQQPSMAGVLEAVVGPWGAGFIGAALIVAVLGAYLSWTLMAAEVLLVAARDGDLPPVFARTNAKDVPVGALTMSTVLVQVLMIVVLFSSDAFDVALNLTSALALIPYFLTAAFGLRVAFADRRGPGTVGLWVVAALATVYTAFLLYAAGGQYVLIALLILVPGTILFALARRRQGQRVFTPWEWVVFALAFAGAVVAIVFIATGVITV
ncbi:basic amino acid/polyamine antiporter [Microbacterium sp. W1N]|uniref:basic amino acid/polyamine antiporter n=1 Tax=Microbacterium festucae TaxID=2977531 RepID=UPI0021C15D86|nr:basic amino acid/polyamine antiporter [Microbacterium festucae]MCT9820578.1 basic amino acid/polyamine antiporter [Microbacterium festucae]